MEATRLCRTYGPLIPSSSSPPPPAAFARFMPAPRPPATTRTTTMAAKKGTTIFAPGEAGPREMSNNGQPVKLLSNVEKLRLLTKAEKAGLLSAAENLGLSLSTVERLGLLSKAENLGVLSAATDTSTPSKLLNLSIALLGLGPAFVFFVPEDYQWEVALQVIVTFGCVVGGSAAFAASSFVANLQRSD